MTRRRWQVYYDGDCGLCRKTVAVLKSQDWFRRCSWVAYQSLNRPPTGLRWDDLRESAILETPSGDYLHGYFAFRKLAGLLPLILLIVPVLHIPWVTRVGTRAYQWIAAHRNCEVAASANLEE